MSTTIFTNVVELLCAGAESVASTVKVQCGTKTSDSGKESPLYATFRLPEGSTVLPGTDTLGAIIDVLKGLGRKPINVTLPAVQTGRKASIFLALRPVQSAETLATALAKLDGREEKAAPASKKRGAGAGADAALAGANGAS